MKPKLFFNDFFKLINILSFDVVLGSVMTGIFACKVLSVEINYWWLLVISLTVWVIYTTDHLLDAWKRKSALTINRHLFHYKHIRIILAFWALAATVSIFLGFMKLQSDIVYLGILIGISILIYFGAIYFTRDKRPLFLQKELFIALIYITGIWLAPIVWYGGKLDGIIWMIIANMVILAWSEGIIVSWYEFRVDIADKHISFTILFGRSFSRKFVYILLSIVLLFSISGIFILRSNTTLFLAFLIEIMISAVLIIVVSFPATFKKDELYRYIGEASFMVQGLILFV